VIAKASLKHLRSSPQKVRLVVDQIRGKGVEDALRALQLSPKAVSRDVEKLLKSAVANAEQREERVDVDDLWVRHATVDTGPTQKRVRYRAMGRIFRILKRSSHVTLGLDLRHKGPAVEPVAEQAPASRKATAVKKVTKKVSKKPAAPKKAAKKTKPAK
jgi:large subunit ribosomal protein L22